jgi:hypothetical protein
MRFGVVIAALAAAGLLAACSTRTDSGSAKEHKPYVAGTCVVSGEKLGSMGDPYVYVYKDPKVPNDPGREVKLCCDGCLADFKKDPAKYFKLIDDAKAAEKK